MGLFSGSFDKLIPVKGTSREKKELPLSTWTGKITNDTEISQCPFVVFDTELTGLNRRCDSIISIGAVKMTGKTIHAGSRFYRLVKPDCEMARDNVVIHRITPGELAEQKPIEEVLPDFLSFIQDSVIAGHFVHIDTDFINRSMKTIYGKKLKNPAIDTYNIHEWLQENDSEFRRHYEGGSTKSDLFSMAKRYKVEFREAHNSLIDAYITAQLFQRFLCFIEKNGISKIKTLIQIGKI